MMIPVLLLPGPICSSSFKGLPGDGDAGEGPVPPGPPEPPGPSLEFPGAGEEAG